MSIDRQSLDTFEPESGSHGECFLLPGSGVAVNMEDITGLTTFHILFQPAQALTLLTWLSEHKPEIEQMIKGQGHE